MPKDAVSKVLSMLDRVEQRLVTSSPEGVAPMAVMLAGVLPMLRQAVVELDQADGGLDAFLDRVVAIYAQLRSDEAAGIIIMRALDVADGAPVARYIRPLLNDDNLGRFVAGGSAVFTVELDEALSVPDLSDGLL